MEMLFTCTIVATRLVNQVEFNLAIKILRRRRARESSTSLVNALPFIEFQDFRLREQTRQVGLLLVCHYKIFLIYLRMQNKAHSMEEETRHVLHHIDLADPESSRCLR